MGAKENIITKNASKATLRLRSLLVLYGGAPNMLVLERGITLGRLGGR